LLLALLPSLILALVLSLLLALLVPLLLVPLLVVPLLLVPLLLVPLLSVPLVLEPLLLLVQLLLVPLFLVPLPLGVLLLLVAVLLVLYMVPMLLLALLLLLASVFVSIFVNIFMSIVAWDLSSVMVADGLGIEFVSVVLAGLDVSLLIKFIDLLVVVILSVLLGGAEPIPMAETVGDVPPGTPSSSSRLRPYHSSLTPLPSQPPTLSTILLPITILLPTLLPIPPPIPFCILDLNSPDLNSPDLNSFAPLNSKLPNPTFDNPPKPASGTLPNLRDRLMSLCVVKVALVNSNSAPKPVPKPVVNPESKLASKSDPSPPSPGPMGAPTDICKHVPDVAMSGNLFVLLYISVLDILVA